ncbi:ANTAR domain-containing response regulator [Cetobacterium sp. 2G large]|uniref:ANTAR domain-containing response regulator n=1 Tax=Cetobacterium sp. 2G large TaxID=2759680 RepID=UPI00163CC000|nr:response regulator [Cetobacterium sp. 2G large]MBC2854474.1 response regulator [Cetobacterium sp. 2G large]
MRKTVVVAEDDSLIRMDLVEMLKENEYDVLGEAKDGLEAVELALRHTPDILLLDLKMPFLLGTNVAKILKEKEYKNCIIMLTAYSVENYIKEATEYDVSGYLIKPLDEKILLSQMDLLYKNYSEKIKLKNALELSERKLKERKMLEKAKGILMCKYSLTEDEAYTKIRKISMEKRISICQLSEIINTTGELL